MKIGIDARFYGIKNKGLGRYTQKLIEELEKIDFENQYFIFLKKSNYDDYQPKNKNFKKVLANYPWYSLQEQIFFPIKIKKYKLDLMHYPHFNVPIFNPTKFVVTVHDLIPFHFPSRAATLLNPLFYKIKQCGYKIVLKSALKKSKKVITVSNFTKNDILKNFQFVPSEKIIVVYEGANFYQDKQEASQNDYYNYYGQYLLYIGNAYPHKNLKILIDAFNLLKQEVQSLNLVIIGTNDYFFQKIKKENNQNKNIIFIDDVDDKDLLNIIKNALILISPSFYEGFGLTNVEAMLLGTPVIASDIEIFQEILKDAAAAFFNPSDSLDLFKKIKKFLNLSEDNKKVIIERGIALAQKYQWKKMAEETLKIYRQLQINKL